MVHGMTDAAPDVSPEGQPGLSRRLVAKAASVTVHASLIATPRLAAWYYRRAFAQGGARTARRLERHSPAGVAVRADERYGPEADMVLDLYRPMQVDGALPVYLWVHGGGWFGGSKEENAGYFKIVASHGYAVVAPRYSLAPTQRYPAPARQIMAALAYLQANADRLELDMDHVVVGGDSAGGQIASQVGALVTMPAYARAVGVPPTITAERLRGLVLACGFYDVGLYAADGIDAHHRRLLKIELWTYSGHRHFLADPLFRTLSVTDHLTADFPPTLITVGNSDPLDIHTHRLIERLQAAGAAPETVLFAPDHRPALEHEYQFELDTAAGQLFLDRTLAFLDRHLRAGGPDAQPDGVDPR